MADRLTLAALRDIYAREGARSQAQVEEREVEFDAAIAEHDREVAEREWEAGVQAAKSAILRHESVTDWQEARLAELIEALVNPHREPDDAGSGS